MDCRSTRALFLIVMFAGSLSGCSGGTGQSFTSVATPSFRGVPQAKTTPAFYLSDLGTAVHVYSADSDPQNPRLLVALSQEITRSGALWVDSKGTAYVVNGCCANQKPYVSIVEFKRGQTGASLQIVSGLNLPGAVAVSSDGTVYVTDVENGTDDQKVGIVLLYKRGQTTPEGTITLPDPAYDLTAGGIVFDAHGDALASTLNPENNMVHIFRISRGSGHAIDTGIQGAEGDSLGIDAAGNLYTANQVSTNGTVAVYAPGATQPTRTYSLGPQIASIAVAANGTLYATTVDTKGLLEVAPGGDTIEQTYQINGVGVALGRY